ncbi:GNAT family N-acetyltransferase [Sphingobium sufflavum]|uniref:GNAT family N-acetyltransferase n=1 Tax=Sphingobium sufflavum TaxID=1129547 RepID=UPI001F2C96F4|nr:GNAT family protein [Sphingobium sufflavum]MCE7798734.1 GNAT family N-acetyltransferase [Sphingobium sufflavum]
MQADQCSGSSIAFRTPATLDFALLADIRRDRRMQSMLMAIPDRTDDAAIAEWIDRRIQEPHGLFRVIVAGERQEAVGFLQISQVHLRNRYGYGALAVSDGCTLPGVALLAMRELIRFARFELGLTKLLAEIRADNDLAIRMNVLLGYQIIGTLRKHFVDHDGARHDVVLLEKIF